jgi:lipid-A-disaccharide synthase-like uncharacterized protein
MTLVYAIGIQDPIFVFGALATGGIFARNAWLDARHLAREVVEKPVVWPIVAGTAAFVALLLVDSLGKTSVFRGGVPLAWSVVGFVGQGAWSGRFLVQWLASERKGRSVLPPSFFSFGFFGSALLAAYALYREDWVNVAAQVLNPIPYGRNWLIQSRAAARAQGETPAGDPPSSLSE